MEFFIFFFIYFTFQGNILRLFNIETKNSIYNEIQTLLGAQECNQNLNDFFFISQCINHHTNKLSWVQLKKDDLGESFILALIYGL